MLRDKADDMQMTVVTCGAETTNHSGSICVHTPSLLSSLSRVRVARSSVFCVVLCRLLFVLLLFFFLPLCCLINPLVSSNFLKIGFLSNILTLHVPDEGYSRDMSSVLN